MMMQYQRKLLRCVIPVLFSLLIIGCGEEKKYGTPNVDVADLQTDALRWYRYHHAYIDLNSDFNALNEESEDISKTEFFQNLQSGDFIPIKMNSTKSTTFYKLFHLEDPDNPIRKDIKSIAAKQNRNYNYLGTKFPEFNYTDLNGNKYSSEDLSKYYTVISFWFVDCVPCEEEIPVINFLKKEYQNSDAIFLSFAFDDPEKLSVFLADKEYDIPVISVSKSYMLNTLGVSAFPTHMILNKERQVVAVTNGTRNLRRRLKEILE